MRDLVAAHTDDPVLGDPVVDVLTLNLALRGRQGLATVPS